MVGWRVSNNGTEADITIILKTERHSDLRINLLGNGTGVARRAEVATIAWMQGNAGAVAETFGLLEITDIL